MDGEKKDGEASGPDVAIVIAIVTAIVTGILPW